VRARHCDNTRFSRRVPTRKHISQCRLSSGTVVAVDPGGRVEDAEETILSAMRRLSDRALGAAPPRTRRARWIANAALTCEQPEGWPSSRSWLGRMQRRCETYSTLARRLISGQDRRRVTGRAIPIAWGGRCESHCEDPRDPSTCRATGACDDPLACRRGLNRIPGTDTGNALWCRRGSRGCPEGIDPVCTHLGYGETTVRRSVGEPEAQTKTEGETGSRS
jgi:hypothetical protein